MMLPKDLQTTATILKVDKFTATTDRGSAQGTRE